MDNYAFTLTPMSQNIDLEPGQTYTGAITISNPADATSDFAYKVSVTPFGVIGKEYTIDLTTEYNRSMLTKWVTISEPTGTIKPNTSQKVEFTIKVPANAPAGGQYAALTVTSNNSSNQDDGLAVQNVFEMASVLYADIAGETVHQSQILENNIPGFSTGISPIVLSALLENTGNVHEYATYTITVKDLFTGQIILPTNDNDGRYSEVIMPETTYYSQREINNLPVVGVINVSQTIRLNGEVSIKEGNIIICPIWFMLLIFVTFAAFVATTVLIIKRHRRRKASKKALL